MESLPEEKGTQDGSYNQSSDNVVNWCDRRLHSYSVITFQLHLRRVVLMKIAQRKLLQNLNKTTTP